MIALIGVAAVAATPPFAASVVNGCVGTYAGCFKDIIPAPGVPPVRVVDHHLVGPTKDMSVQSCVSGCQEHGYSYAGLTGHAGAYNCYCGCAENDAAPVTLNATCAAPCAGANEPNGHCGHDGCMSAYRIDCTPKQPPSPVCGGGGPGLPKGPACSQAAAKGWKFCDATAPLHDRVTDLVNRITILEAGPLLTARSSAAIPRLGLPSFYWGTNAIHGVQLGNSTTFPEPLNVGATFNRTVMRGVGRTIGREMRAWRNAGLQNVGLTSWSPTINIIRDQRWGRNQETVSEDPLLAGEYGKQFAMGMQYNLEGGEDGDDGNAGVPPPRPAADQFMAVATLKHVLAYSVDDWSAGNYSDHTYNRVNYDSEVPLYDLEDTYSQPFKRAISEGGAAGIMYACNKVNGVPAVASADLASRLRSWGFNGYRTTDGDGIAGITDHARQNYTATIEEAITIALRDGESDIDDGGTYASHLVDAYANGKANLTLEVVHRALYNTFQIRFRLGLFDPSSTQPWLNYTVADDVDSPESRQLNIEASRQSLILLQNKGSTLPFKAPTKNVVVIGGSANSTRLFGGGHYARGLTPQDHFLAIPAAIEKVLADIGSDAAVEYHQGIGCAKYSYNICVRPTKNSTLVATAVQAARDAAQVVVVLNLQSVSPCDSDKAVADGGEFNPCGYEAEQHDRPHSTLPKLQNEMALAVLAAAKTAGVPAAVVLVHGGGMAIDEVKVAADAIVDAHYPGMATGAIAIAELLYGRFSPAGKLTYSLMPAAFDNMSNFSQFSMTAPPGRSYKYYPTDPSTMPPALFPFGFGLTFTEWNISVSEVRTTRQGTGKGKGKGNGAAGAAGADATVNVPGADADPTTYAVEIKNVGGMDSDEVVQVYFAPPAHLRQGVPTPKLQLIDFKKVHVAAGSSTTITFTVARKDLALPNADGSRSLVPGKYKIGFTNGATVGVTADFVI